MDRADVIFKQIRLLKMEDKIREERAWKLTLSTMAMSEFNGCC